MLKTFSSKAKKTHHYHCFQHNVNSDVNNIDRYSFVALPNPDNHYLPPIFKEKIIELLIIKPRPWLVLTISSNLRIRKAKKHTIFLSNIYFFKNSVWWM